MTTARTEKLIEIVYYLTKQKISVMESFTFVRIYNENGNIYYDYGLSWINGDLEDFAIDIVKRFRLKVQ